MVQPCWTLYFGLHGSCIYSIYIGKSLCIHMHPYIQTYTHILTMCVCMYVCIRYNAKSKVTKKNHFQLHSMAMHTIKWGARNNTMKKIVGCQIHSKKKEKFQAWFMSIREIPNNIVSFVIKWGRKWNCLILCKKPKLVRRNRDTYWCLHAKQIT